MVDAVVSFVLELITDFIVDEVKSIRGVPEKVRSLERELQAIKCFLRDADAKSNHDESVKNWIAEVREISFDAEDILESFVLEGRQQRPPQQSVWKKGLSVFRPQHGLMALREFGDNIDGIRQRLNDVQQRRHTFGIKRLGEDPGRFNDQKLNDWRHVCLLREDFVGMEEEVEKILGDVLDEANQSRLVIAIVGMGGLGKTTLANRVYNKAKNQFSCCVKLTVSKEYSPDKLLRGIIQQVENLGNESLVNLSRDKLEEMLKGRLKGTRYFIFVDDVWERQPWEDILKPCLPDDNNGSRVIITTRDDDVATTADSRRTPHRPRFLNIEESWELLSKKAFGDQNMEEVNNPGLEELGRRIAEKCKGLPLALEVIGGLLNSKGPAVGEWKKVAENPGLTVMKEEKCEKLLSLSYADLPHHLKGCFLYFSSIPEDFEIEVEKLTRLWISEGLVDDEPNRPRDLQRETLEDFAEKSLEELVRRCLISIVQTVHKFHDQNFPPLITRKCRIHDLLHEMTIAKSKEVGFLRQWGSENKDKKVTSFIKGYKDEDPKAKVRTVLGFNLEAHFSIEFPIGGENFKRLRVVDLEGAPLNELPKEIGQLIFLRYLGLRGTELLKLPSSLGKLKQLRSLDLLHTLVGDLPKDVWEMKALRHLQIGICQGIMPEIEVTSLKNLQVLEIVRAGEWLNHCRGNLTGLRDLHLRCIKTRHHEAIMSWFPQLTRLKSLKLAGSSLPDIFGALPDSLQALFIKGKMLTSDQTRSNSSKPWPSCLIELSLFETSLDPWFIRKLGELYDLTTVYLGSSSFSGAELLCSEEERFRRLTYLTIDSLPELMKWELGDKAMLQLKSLRVNKCPNLIRLPQRLKGIAGLEELKLKGISRRLSSKIQRDGEDWGDIQHVPSITITAGQ